MNTQLALESYKEKFESLKPWVMEIFDAVKKDIKSDHLPKNPALTQKYFSKKSTNKLTTQELAAAYLQELNEGNEELGEWIASRWIMRHAEIYQFFAQKLTAINPKFDEIKEISDDVGQKFASQAMQQFGASAAYIFSLINAVVFSPKIFAEMRTLAEKEAKERSAAAPEEQKTESLVELRQRYEKELAKLHEKYEEKFAGFMKKYNQDVEGYKKQIAQLQRKLNG